MNTVTVKSVNAVASTEWASNKLDRFQQMKPLLKGAGVGSSPVWDRMCSAPSLAEFVANRLGNKAKQRDSNRRAFQLYLNGDLALYREDSGKALSSDSVLAIMLGRVLSASGTVGPVGNARDGWKPAYSAYHVANQSLIRQLDKLVASTGGFMRPAVASDHADASKRVSVAETARLIVQDAEALALTENGKRSLSARSIAFASLANSNANSATMLLPAPTEPVESAKDKKNRKARERRAALKASKSSK